MQTEPKPPPLSSDQILVAAFMIVWASRIAAYTLSVAMLDIWGKQFFCADD